MHAHVCIYVFLHTDTLDRLDRLDRSDRLDRLDRLDLWSALQGTVGDWQNNYFVTNV